jgi:hypothetical protein
MDGIAKIKKFSNRINAGILDSLYKEDDGYEPAYDTQLHTIDDKDDEKSDGVPRYLRQYCTADAAPDDPDDPNNW